MSPQACLGIEVYGWVASVGVITTLCARAVLDPNKGFEYTGAGGGVRGVCLRFKYSSVLRCPQSERTSTFQPIGGLH